MKKNEQIIQIIEARFNRQIFVNNVPWRVSEQINLHRNNIAGIFLIELAIFDTNQKFVQPFIINRQLLQTLESVRIEGKQLIMITKPSIIGITKGYKNT